MYVSTDRSLNCSDKKRFSSINMRKKNILIYVQLQCISDDNIVASHGIRAPISGSVVVFVSITKCTIISFPVWTSYYIPEQKFH